MADRNTSRSLWRNKTFVAYFFTLSLLALLFFGATVWAMGQLKATRSVLAAQQAGQEGQAAALLDMARLRDIDTRVIAEARYSDGLVAYRELREGATGELSSALDQRIAALEAILESRDNGTPSVDPKDLLLNQYRQTIQQLEERRDDLQRSIGMLADSLQGRMEDLIAEMKRKERELGKKEQVQVISFPSSKGQKVHYLGEVRDGKANGGGVGIWTTGSVYRGQWRNNQRHGEGTFDWADGERYEGTYVDGSREGFGKYFWPSGDRYEGQWKGDRRNGQGTLFDMDGNVRYKGMWKDDKPAD